MKEEFKFKTTAELKTSKKIIEQVIGQEEAVNLVKKASRQRRHVLLIGEPGTGKSMLGMALAELLPKEKLVDTLAFMNPNDENMPLIRTYPAGAGREAITTVQNIADILFFFCKVFKLYPLQYFSQIPAVFYRAMSFSMFPIHIASVQIQFLALLPFP